MYMPGSGMGSVGGWIKMNRMPVATPLQRTLAHGVHLLTASGVVFALLAAIEIVSDHCDPRIVFAWFCGATLVDAIDGPLARRFQVKQRAPRYDGRTIDDIIDYLTFTFLPLLLIWRMDWLPGPAAAAGLVALAMLVSLLGFANVAAKQERRGFFLGFPSYWNVVAFYAGLWFAHAGPWPNAIMLVTLTILTVVPIRFVYPNLAPPPWRRPVLVGAYLWLALLLAMLPWYPDLPLWLVALSLVYPVLYTAVSICLDVRARRRMRKPGEAA